MRSRRATVRWWVVGAVIVMFGITAVTVIRGRQRSAAQQQPRGFAVTGSLAIPGQGSAMMTRLEDRETGIVCYMAPTGFFSCAAKK
jgi:hypothetical protein